MANITCFKIWGLHGYKNFEIKFKNNTLILVGENGSGKTSVLRIFYYFLTCEWLELAKFNFDKIQLIINDKKLEIKKSDLKYNEKYNSLIKHLPPPIRENYQSALDNMDTDKMEYIIERYISPHRLRYYNDNFFNEDGFEILRDNIQKTSKEKLDSLTKEINENVDFTILYLPTYRRIERELKFILKGYDEDDYREKSFKRRYFRNRNEKNHIELIEFGMKDVEKAKDKVLESLKEFQRTELNRLTLKYLGDVVNKTYETVKMSKIKKATEEDIDNVLSRIDEVLLNKTTKNKLREAIREIKSKDTKEIIDDKHTKVICHYFMKLLEFQELLEQREGKMRDFCEICNKYITDKSFCYQSSSFEFFIVNKNLLQNDEQDIKFEQLSSGEKQIVSLFSQLYLTDNNDYFVIIDEPELSLSVPWQKTFLVDIKNGDFCKGLFAVTHSPFIYDNELELYTHGLGEFNK